MEESIYGKHVTDSTKVYYLTEKESQLIVFGQKTRLHVILRLSLDRMHIGGNKLFKIIRQFLTVFDTASWHS